MNVSPDGARYLAMGRGATVPYPFQFRFLLPWVCGTSERRWVAAGWLGAALLVATTGAWAWQVTDSVEHAVTAALLVATLRGAVHLQLVQYPVLVDLPAMGFAAVGAYVLRFGGDEWWWTAVAVAAISLAAMTKESAPVFAALWAGSAWPLLACVAVAINAMRLAPGPDVTGLGPMAYEALDHPVRASRLAHRGRWFDGGLWLLPWGPCLLALVAPSWLLAGTLAIAYGQCLVATDSERLYQWACLPMAVAAVAIVPTAALPAVAVAAVWWPWKGTGL